MKNEPRDKQHIQNIKTFIAIVLIIISLSLSITSYIINLQKYKTVKIEHTEKSSLDYKAFLVENSGFNPNYRLPGETIIPSIIDFIDIVLTYEDTYTNPVSGSYEYYVKGQVIANKPNSDTNYWKSDEIQVTDKKNLVINNVSGYNIVERININYHEYLQYLQSFKDNYPISTEGFLIIDLMVKPNVTIDETELSNKLDYKSVLTMRIPLSDIVIEKVITNNLVKKTTTISSEKVKKDGIIYDISFPAFIIFFCITLIIAVRLYEYTAVNSKTYRNKLNKILTTYDSIIVAVNNIPSVEGIDVIEVNDFEELLNAHSEVRQPINFYEDKKNHKAYFILHNGNMAWKYVLRGKSRKRRKK